MARHLDISFFINLRSSSTRRQPSMNFAGKEGGEEGRGGKGGREGGREGREGGREGGRRRLNGLYRSSHLPFRSMLL